jgi:hypothetical protein
LLLLKLLLNTQAITYSLAHIIGEIMPAVFLVVLGLPLGMSPFLVLFIGKVQHICIKCLVQLDAIWMQALLTVLSFAALAYHTLLRCTCAAVALLR